MKKTVLITGTSSGIGKETALYFFEKDWNVVATMRNPKDRKTELHGKKIDIRHLDVMDIASIKDTVDYIKKTYGKIDVLVNNAGFAVKGLFEASTTDEIRKQYDTNVFGLMEVLREVLPVMREQKDGTVINIASIGGKVGFPQYSLYNSTKWAVEGFSEALHYELRPLHIRVKVVEPGLIKTDFYDRSMVVSDNRSFTEYNGFVEISDKKIKAMEPSGSHPKVIAKTIYQAACDRSFRLRYAKGKNAKMLLLMRKILPDSAFFALLRVFTA